MDLSGWQQAGAAPGAEQVGRALPERLQAASSGAGAPGVPSKRGLRGAALGQPPALVARLLACEG